MKGIRLVCFLHFSRESFRGVWYRCQDWSISICHTICFPLLKFATMTSIMLFFIMYCDNFVWLCACLYCAHRSLYSACRFPNLEHSVSMLILGHNRLEQPVTLLMACLSTLYSINKLDLSNNKVEIRSFVLFSCSRWLSFLFSFSVLAALWCLYKLWPRYAFLFVYDTAAVSHLNSRRCLVRYQVLGLFHLKKTTTHLGHHVCSICIPWTWGMLLQDSRVFCPLFLSLVWFAAVLACCLVTITLRVVFPALKSSIKEWL